MHRPYTFISLALACSHLPAQVQHSLDFDGAGDQVTVTGASQHTVNANAFSLTCWVYPRNASSNFPDMEGFAGFRDDATCDFYLLQTYGATLEGRFRNSVNTVFTLAVPDALTMNVWQHLALVYTGTELRMYRDGQLLTSTEAWGSNANPSRPFHIGNLPYIDFNYWLDGRVDEVALWRRGLSAAEIACLKDFGADPSDPDLRLYYRMDQGMEGGDNADITSLVNATGQQSGSFSGMALTGNSSNFMAGAPVAGTSVASLCPGGSIVLGGQVITAPGTYVAMVPLPSGCDSLVVLQVDDVPVDTAVVQNGPELMAMDDQGPWQWVDCANGFAPIPGATGQAFVPDQDGSYAVQISVPGCVAVSGCHSVLGTGLSGPSAPATGMRYADGLLMLEVPRASGPADALLFDAAGRPVMRWPLAGEGRTERALPTLPPGVYLLRVQRVTGAEVFRFVHQP